MATAAGLAPLCCPAHTCIGYLVNAMSPTARLALTWSYPAGHMYSIAMQLGHTQRRASGKAQTSSSLLVQVQLHRLLVTLRALDTLQVAPCPALACRSQS